MIVKILDTQDPEMDELCIFEGILYNDWLSQWHSLSHHERTSYNHPAWIISGIKAATAAGEEKVLLYIFYDEERFVGAVPFLLKKLWTPFGVQCWLMSFSKRHIFANLISYSIPTNYRREAFTSLFESEPVKGAKPLMIFFNALKENDIAQFDGFYRKSLRWWTEGILDVSRGYEAIRKRQSKNQRRLIKKATKRLDQLPELRLESSTGGPGLAEAFQDFVGMEARGWKGEKGIAMQKNEHQHVFYDTLIKGLSGTGEIIIYSLKTREEFLAKMICYKQDSMLHFLKITYNEEFSEVSPGKMLADRVIRECCIAENINAINFIYYDFKWHMTWRPDKSELYSLAIIQKSWKGLLVWAFASCWMVIKDAKDRCQKIKVRR